MSLDDVAVLLDSWKAAIDGDDESLRRIAINGCLFLGLHLILNLPRDIDAIKSKNKKPRGFAPRSRSSDR